MFRQGSIIEYSYATRWEPIQDWLLRSQSAAYYFSQLSPELTERWIIQDGLFTKRAHFSLKPIPNIGLAWTWSNLRGNTAPAVENRVLQYDATDIPGLEAEDYIRPENSLKSRIEFFYVFRAPPKDAKGTSWCWTDMGKRIASAQEREIGRLLFFAPTDPCVPLGRAVGAPGQ